MKYMIVTVDMFSEEYANSGKLEAMFTKQLLNLRDYCLSAGDWWRTPDDPEYRNSTTILYNKIKEILATREHIPNKQEAKKIRQEKAKAGH